MSDQLDRLTSALAASYTIERELGAGGTATVYLAHDVKHNRKVAVKVLRAELAAAVGAERFLREIEVTAGLQHPHILPLFDSGEADGLLYYVVPFIEGESLRDKLDREKQIPTEEALRLAEEVAGALDYAHGRGLVHRDIKPANVLLSQGHAIVADFGIARAISASGAAGMTQAGMAVGTPWYMSPEQATGDSNIDGRTDVYALGCVLFEMLSGKPPFDAPSAQAIIAKTISAPTPRLEDVSVSVPILVQRYLERALAKDPADRFQTAGEFAELLRQRTGEGLVGQGRRRWAVPALAGIIALLVVALLVSQRSNTTAAAVVAGAEVIAVLPFSVSGADVEYLAEGMVDLLSTNLGGVGGIRTVDSRRVISTWRKRGGETGLAIEDALAVGREVDAGSVLVGSVVEAGSSVRFGAELFRVNGDEIARVQLDGSADSVLTLVDSLSLRLLRAAWRSREPLPSVSVSGITSGSMDAIRAHLKGASYYRQGQWDSAVTFFQNAVELDSTFALAHLRLASSHGWIHGLGSADQRTATDAAVRFADRLGERDRAVVMAYQHFQRNEIAAIDTMRAYVRRYPSDAQGWHLLGDVQFHGRGILGLSLDEQLEPFDRAIALDSSFSPAVVHPAELTLQNGDQERYRRYLGLMSPNVQQVPQLRFLATLSWGDPEPALAALDSLTRSGLGLAAAGQAVVRLPPARRRPALQRLDSIIEAVEPAPVGPWLQGRIVQWNTSMALGNLARAASIAARLIEHPLPGLQIMGRGMAHQMALAGYDEPGDAERIYSGLLDTAGMQTKQFAALSLAQLAVARGDAARARELLASVPPTVASNRGFAIDTPALYRAIRGWASLAEGDTATAVAEMRVAIEDFGLIFVGLQSGTGVMRLQLATVLARDPQTRQEGINRLRYGFVLDPELETLAHLAAAEVLEEVGDREQSAALYSSVLDRWSDADPALQTRVAAARAALLRVSSEPGQPAVRLR